jgi:GntR family transcriptional regulator
VFARPIVNQTTWIERRLNPLEIDVLADKSLDRHNPIPLHQQLSDLLAAMIREGQLKTGEQLPSENELISRFNVSRFVVRQTLANLSRQGLIQTERGRGSFVAPRKIVKPLDVLQSYHAGMQKAGIEVDVRILNKSIVIPPEDVAEKLGLKRNEKTFLLERVACTDGAPLNLLISYISLQRCSESTLVKFDGGSLYQFLGEACDIQLTSSHNNIEIIFASEYESRLLNSPRGAVLLQILGVSLDKSGAPVEFSRVVYPGFMFSFQFDSYKTEGSGADKTLLIR